jgi:two-component system sensor histidine kinase YesM
MIRRLYHLYKYRISLRGKLMITHLILILAPALLIAGFSYRQMVGVTTQTTLRSINTLADQTKNNLGSTLEQLSSLTDGICSNTFFSSFTASSHPSYYESFYDLSGGLTSLENILAAYENNPLVSNIRIYMDEEHYQVLKKYTKNPVFENLDTPKGTYWHGIFSSTDSDDLLCPPRYLSPTEAESLGSHARIRRISGTNSECYVVIYFNQSIIQPILLQDLPYNNSVIYIINSREENVASTNTTISSIYRIPYNEVTEQIPSSLQQEKLQFAGENVYCGYKRIPNSDWIMILAVPESNLLSEGRELLLHFLLIYALVLIICVIVSQLLSRSITRRLSLVAESMQQVKVSALPARLPDPIGSDEISSLMDSYNYMSDEINRLLKEQQETAKELRQSEFRALQAQINPHFLYNTLDMINWMAQTGDNGRISEAVTLLSRFYKLTLNRGSAMMTVRQELEHVTLYVQLQNMRFSDKLHFFVDVPDEMLEYTMPKLIFQPIVENSIFHGILEKPIKEGNIVLMGWMEDDVMVFTVSDDGVGMPPEKLATILTGQHTDGESRSGNGSNIAIFNTHKRIQLAYGSQYGLSYHSTAGSNTEVEIRIPKT